LSIWQMCSSLSLTHTLTLTVSVFLSHASSLTLFLCFDSFKPFHRIIKEREKIVSFFLHRETLPTRHWVSKLRQLAYVWLDSSNPNSAMIVLNLFDYALHKVPKSKGYKKVIFIPPYSFMGKQWVAHHRTCWYTG